MPGPATGAGSPHSLWPVTPFVLWPCVTLAATMTKLLVAKVLCMVGVFFFMLLGSLLPVKVIEADLEKAHRSKKVLSLCNTFGGGVFLATCFNALLPAVRDKLQQVLSLGHISTNCSAPGDSSSSGSGRSLSAVIHPGSHAAWHTFRTPGSQ